MTGIRKIEEELTGVGSIAISGHMRPDGDCLGSCMGLYLYLKENFPQLECVDVYLQEYPDTFDIISETDRIRHSYDHETVYDLFIALDCGDAQRLAEFEECFHNARRTVCYDHHISNTGFADVNYIDPNISSTSELIFHVMDEEKISKRTAEALYMGISHDTGIFQYSCTSPETMITDAALMRKGINCSYINDFTYMEKTFVQNQILGRALLESRLILDGRCIYSMVNRRDMEFYGVAPKDLDGIVSQMRLTKGVEVAFFLYETEENVFKASIRSKTYADVSKVAGHFGGGGHVRAAGCTMYGEASDVAEELIRQIGIQLQQDKIQ